MSLSKANELIFIGKQLINILNTVCLENISVHLSCFQECIGPSLCPLFKHRPSQKQSWAGMANLPPQFKSEILYPVYTHNICAVVI